MSLGKNLLNKKFVHITAIDEVEQEVLGQLLSQIYPDEIKACLSIVHNPRGQQGTNISYTHEYAFLIYPNDTEKFIADIKRDEIDSRNLRDSGTESDRTDAATCFYPFIVKNGKIIEIGQLPKDDFHPVSANVEQKNGMVEIWPIDESGNEKKWRYSRGSVEGILNKLEAKQGRNSLQIIFNKDTGTMRSLWVDAKYDASEYGTKVLQDILGKEIAGLFTYPKSIFTVKDLVRSATIEDKKAIILDYFSGSGTTGHAVLKLNKDDCGRRKFILIEMGQYFDTVLKLRIQKVFFSDNWKDGTPQDSKGLGGFFKYIYLEQYEDALENIEFKTSQLKLKDRSDLCFSYAIHAQGGISDSKTFLGVDIENNFLDFKIKTLDDKLNLVESKVDLVETFNYLIGIWVDKYEFKKDEKHEYVIVKGKVDNDQTVIIWRDPNHLNREKDAEFINTHILEGKKWARIYVNTDCNLPDNLPKPIHIFSEFRKKMFDGVSG